MWTTTCHWLGLRPGVVVASVEAATGVAGAAGVSNLVNNRIGK